MKKIVLLSFICLFAISAKAQSPLPWPKLVLQVGKDYQYEFGTKFPSNWESVYEGYYDSRVWYRIHVNAKTDDSTYACSVKVVRVYAQKQLFGGTQIYDSEYAAPAVQPGDHEKILGFAFQCTLSDRGVFKPAPGTEAAAMRVWDAIVKSQPAEPGPPSYRHVKETLSNAYKAEVFARLYKNLNYIERFASNRKAPPVPAEKRLSPDEKGYFEQENLPRPYRFSNLEYLPKPGRYSLITARNRQTVEVAFVDNNTGLFSGRFFLPEHNTEAVFSLRPLQSRPATITLVTDALKPEERQVVAWERKIRGLKQVAPGKFQLTYHLTGPTVIGLPLVGIEVFIRPGESLEVTRQRGNPVSFKGVSAEENRFLQDFEQRYGALSANVYAPASDKRTPEQEIERLENDSKARLEALDQLKLTVDPDLLMLMKSGYTYENALALLYFFTVHGPEHPHGGAENILSAYLKDKPFYSADFAGKQFFPYDRFLSVYDNYVQMFGKRDYTINKNGPPDAGLELSRIKSTYGGYPYQLLTAKTLLQSLEEPWKDSLSHKTELKAFLAASKDTTVNRFIRNAFAFKAGFERGKTFPDLKLTDANGRHTTLSSLAGKKLVAYFLWNHMRLQEEVDSLNRLHQQFPDITVAYIYGGSDSAAWKKVTLPGSAKSRLFSPVTTDDEQSDFLQLFYWSAGGSMRYVMMGKDLKIYRVSDRIDLLAYIDDNLVELRSRLAEFSAFSPPLIDPNFRKWVYLNLGLLFLALATWGIIRWRSRVITKREAQKRRIAEAELKSIRARLNPHFLFNTMNSILHLINSDEKEKASAYLSDLAVLLRTVLKNTEKGQISLAEELESTRKYLQLEQLRFAFSYSIEVDKGLDIHTTLVPAMFLQPYVENAVIHGITPKGGQGTLTLSATGDGDRVIYRVEDNGPGIDHSSSHDGNKLGLVLTAEKLEIVYGKTASVKLIDLGNSASGKTGTRVEISLPSFI